MTTLPSDTYASFILSRPLPEVWNIFLLALGRITAATALAPFFGGKTLAAPFKLGLSVAIVFILLPSLIVQTKTTPTLDALYILLLVKEVLVGLVLGIIISIPFYYAQGAGALIDHQRGAQSLQVMDPSTQIQTSSTGTLYNNMMLVIFFSFGGHMLFLEALFSTFAILPIDQFIPAEFFDENHPFWIAIIGMLTTVISITLQLCSPSMISMLLSDLFLGIANRMAPQVQISFLLWSLKAFVGLAMLWAAWWFVFKQLDVQAHSWLKLTQQLIHSF